MKTNSTALHRRTFIQQTALTIAGASSLSALPMLGYASPYADDNLNIIGPLEGYSPQIGILVSMMAWNRASVINAVNGLTQQDLDFLIDDKSNTIGALLLHLAATDTVYQDLTFNNLKDFSDENKKKWGVAMELGDEGRKQIKGNNLDYYLNALHEVRQKTLDEFKKRDHKWLAQVDPHFFNNQPTNNFCKWFHVCEHESNHRGQITVIRKRLPGSKSKAE
ncbi:DinB family protein [Danxiaibacter flavus]|uniref:DinB family protein n=1 Tax=Danxiaibacter flavus TaxID=3049108 RepID=A0ABV3ZAN2_9BACT|nr:DinB family protein [Chitinophagaceae bacterium DXS]